MTLKELFVSGWHIVLDRAVIDWESSAWRNPAVSSASPQTFISWP